MVDPCPVPRVQSKLERDRWHQKHVRICIVTALERKHACSYSSCDPCSNHTCQNKIIRSAFTFSVTVKTRTVKMMVPYDQFPKTCRQYVNEQRPLQKQWHHTILPEEFSVKPGHCPGVLGYWTDIGHQRRRVNHGRLPIKSSTGTVPIVTLHSFQSVCGKGVKEELFCACVPC